MEREKNNYNILDYGAVGDKATVNSRSIQMAVDDCAKNGGGKVYIPAGTFLTGTIYLRNNVYLYLENGATLLGSPSREDYNDDEVASYFRGGNSGWEIEHVSSCHLIYARHARNVGIYGHGIIDGNNKHFWGKEQSASGLKRWKCSEWRPNAMIAFNECENVRLADITVTNATYWTTWFYACGNVKITGVSILNDRFVPNGDGLSIERCKDVIVNNCVIHTADDAIALRSGGMALASDQWPLENVVVSNCILSTPCAAIRLGPEGDAAIRNCVFSNITIQNSGSGIYFSFWDLSNEKYKIWRAVHGPKIENITFSNMIIDADYPIRMHVNNEQSTWPAYVRNVNIQDIIAHARCFCHIESNRLVPFENIKLSNIDLTVGGNMIVNRKDAADSTTAFFLKNVSGMSMRNINISFDHRDKRHDSKAIKIENCKEVQQENINVSCFA